MIYFIIIPSFKFSGNNFNLEFSHSMKENNAPSSGLTKSIEIHGNYDQCTASQQTIIIHLQYQNKEKNYLQRILELSATKSHGKK